MGPGTGDPAFSGRECIGRGCFVMTPDARVPPPEPVGRGDNARRVLLAVGVTAAPRLPPGWGTASLVHVAWAELSAASLARVLPDAVLAPLWREGFDAVELAERLAGWGFGGWLLVAAPPLPNPRVVQRDIAAACPGIRVLLLTCR